MDGSHHDWFEGRRAEAVLMVMIDDATGGCTCDFSRKKLRRRPLKSATLLCESFFLLSFYVDHAFIYLIDRESTSAKIISDKQPETYFFLAMVTLVVLLILSNIPHFKFLLYLINFTLHYLLFNSLLLYRITDLANAIRYLEENLLTPFNANFEFSPQRKRIFMCRAAFTLFDAFLFFVLLSRVI